MSYFTFNLQEVAEDFIRMEQQAYPLPVLDDHQICQGFSFETHRQISTEYELPGGWTITHTTPAPFHAVNQLNSKDSFIWLHTPEGEYFVSSGQPLEVIVSDDKYVTVFSKQRNLMKDMPRALFDYLKHYEQENNHN